MHGPATPARGEEIARELTLRLLARADDETRPAAARLADIVGLIHSYAIKTGITRSDLRQLLHFVTEVGHSSDQRRQEWVLLADVLGLSALVEDINADSPAGATSATLVGPFYRDDAPALPLGADICLDGRGERLDVTGTVSSLGGTGIAGAQVEVWHANGEGLYENQEPDRQPEYNLRGRFITDAAGRFQFRTVRPKGYHLPEDGPVGELLNALGYRLERPAHISFRVSAEGYRVLTTEFFDRDDPAIGCDALFNVKPDLLVAFNPVAGAHPRWSVHVPIVLAPRVQPGPKPER